MSPSAAVFAFVAAGGGGAAVAFGLFRAFGERWLKSKFDARLQNLRHEHNRQMKMYDSKHHAFSIDHHG